MEYNRLVAYIYSYNDGVKSKNTGFAKIEVRQNVLKLQINMKGAYSDSGSPWKVNLFYRDSGRIRGITLGEINIKNGAGDYRYAGNADDIANSGKSFDSIKGLYIMSGESVHKLFASEWDDLGFAPEKIGTAGSDFGESGAGATVVEFVQPTSVQEQPQFFNDNLKRAIERQSEKAGESDSRVFQAAQALADSENSFDSQENSGTSDSPYSESSPCSADRTDSENSPYGALDDIINGRDKMFLFADDDLYDVVEIGVDDINSFPGVNKALFGNSFVNHGYYNFRHLILGRMHESRGCGYFIGVPGVYTRRDRSTASMFGFDYFKFSMRSDVRLGQFGYWYRELK